MNSQENWKLSEMVSPPGGFIVWGPLTPGEVINYVAAKTPETLVDGSIRDRITVTFLAHRLWQVHNDYRLPSDLRIEISVGHHARMFFDGKFVGEIRSPEVNARYGAEEGLIQITEQPYRPENRT